MPPRLAGVWPISQAPGHQKVTPVSSTPHSLALQLIIPWIPAYSRYPGLKTGSTYTATGTSIRRTIKRCVLPAKLQEISLPQIEAAFLNSVHITIFLSPLQSASISAVPFCPHLSVLLTFHFNNKLLLKCFFKHTGAGKQNKRLRAAVSNPLNILGALRTHLK